MVSSYRAYQRKRDYDNGGGSDHHDDHVRTQHFAIAVYHGSGGKHPRAGRCLWCLSCPLICHLNIAFSSHVNEPSCQWTHGSPVARTLIVTVAVASVIRFFIETSTMLRNLSHFPQSLRTGLAPVKRGCFLRTAAVAALATSRLRVTRGTPVIRYGLITVLFLQSLSLANWRTELCAFANSSIPSPREGREFFPPDLHLHMIRRLCEYSAHFANVTLLDRDPRIARHPRQA